MSCGLCCRRETFLCFAVASLLLCAWATLACLSIVAFLCPLGSDARACSWQVGAFLLEALTRVADVPLKYLPAEAAERIREQHRAKGPMKKASRLMVPAFSKDHVYTK